MTLLSGHYFDGRTSHLRNVTVSLEQPAALRVAGEDINFSCSLDDVRVSSRVGNARRHLYFNDGSQVETEDNDAVDRMFSGMRGQRRHQLLHKLESRIGYAVGALCVTAIVIWLGINYVIPGLATRIAFSMPQATEKILGQQALATLDKVMLEPSRLADARQSELQRVFSEMTAEIEGAQDYQLMFRASGKVGPNAFALPSGIVVMTDSLVDIAQDDNELIAVLAHEIGHLQQRHELRRLLQNSTTGLLLVAVTGDLSSLASIGAWLPALLVDRKYSRAFESEADKFSMNYLAEHGIPKTALADILQRMEKKSPAVGRLPDYLSSHPATQLRIQKTRDN